MTSLQWMNDALCRQIGPDIFFPEGQESTKDARQACALCRVKEPCLEFALTHPVEGIWAGTTPRQRRAMKGAAYRQHAS